MAATLTSASIHVDCRAATTKSGRATTGYISKNRQFTNGTGESQAEKCYYEERTIAYSSTPDNLDFAGGGLIDTNGDTITWTEMVGLVIKADDDNTVDLTVGNGTNPLNFGSGSSTITIKPGEAKVLMNTDSATGYPVSAGSADNLKIAIPSGVNQIYEVWALGRTA
jgi:hypothetical protein